MYPDPDYPHDLYDEERASLNSLKRSYFIMGVGFGIMLTVLIASAVAVYIG